MLKAIGGKRNCFHGLVKKSTSCMQVAAMRAIDRERQIFDEVANLLHSRTLLPAVTTALYADLVSQHMELLGFR